MSRTVATSERDVEHELGETARALQTLCTSLESSYQSLEARAQRVEKELARTNRELERKVTQLDAVTADLEAILEALPTGVIVRDASGRIVRINSAALDVLNARSEDVLGTEDTALGACAGEAWVESELERADGRRSIVARRCSAIRAKHGAKKRATLGGSVEILDDRTQLKELAERLHSLDKLAALGNMAGGIAHELRNPMMAVKGFAALLAGRLERETQEQRWAHLIVEGVGEAEQVLTSMLTLAKPEALTLETVDAVELAQAALRLARHDVELDQGVKYELEQVCDAPDFVGDRIKLRQALRNLVANALHAQPRGGRVRLAITHEGAEIVARVSDAGPGIPRNLRRAVLEPFFTTRAEGTGLGLALVQRIAELHGGCVEISPLSSSLGGADVLLRLPYRSPQS